MRFFWSQHRIRNSRSGRQRIDTATASRMGGEGRLQAKKQVIRPQTANQRRSRKGGCLRQTRPKSERSAQELACAKPSCDLHHDIHRITTPAGRCRRPHTSDGERGKLRPAAVYAVGGRWRKWPVIYVHRCAREDTAISVYSDTLPSLLSGRLHAKRMMRHRKSCLKGELEPLGNLTVIWVSCPLVGSVSARQTRARQGSTQMPQGIA